MAVIESSHSRVERFKFASFDAGKAAPEVMAETAPELQPIPSVMMSEPEMLPPPTFSEHDLAQAKQAGYQTGFAAAQQEAEAKRNKEAEESAASLRSLLEVIANRITLASGDHAALLKNQQDLTLKLSLAIARKVAGDALKREPYTSVETLLKECTNMIGSHERLVITVAPQKSEALQQNAEALKHYLNNFEGEIVIEADEKLDEHDCRVEWKNGQANRDTEMLWNDIESLLKKTVLTN